MLFSQQFFLILQGILSFISQLNRLRIRIYLVENYREFMVLYARGGGCRRLRFPMEKCPQKWYYTRVGDTGIISYTTLYSNIAVLKLITHIP